MATHMAALIQMLSQTLSATEPESMDAALYAMDIAASLVGHVDQANVQPFRALIPLVRHSACMCFFVYMYV